MENSTRILIAGHVRMFREGLCQLLQTEPGMVVVGEAADGCAAIEMAGRLLPDVVIMGIDMPNLNGVDVTRILGSKNNGPKVIALSSRRSGRFVAEMLNAGAKAYVLKDASYRELSAALHAVVANKVYLCSSATELIAKGFQSAGMANSETSFAPSSPLSQRERQILQLISEGKTTKEVATIIGVSSKTVEVHRRNIMRKLKLDSIAALTKYAIQQGITSVDHY